MLSFGNVLRRAITVGAVAAIALAAYTFFVVEPTVDDAIALEEAMSASAGPALDAGHHEDDPLFTRPEQVRGGMAATALYALIGAGIFGTVFAAVRHLLPGRDDLGRSIWLAAMGWGALVLMPGIKYPANPPAVGDPDTVGERTAQYLLLVAVCLVLMVGLTALWRALRTRIPEQGTRVVVLTLVTAVAFGLVLIGLPDTPDSIDPAVPARLIWDFRIQSLGGLTMLWAMLGIGTGWLVAHDVSLEADHEPVPAPA
jgi:predicted cobalt transporter CbtA